jgi:hypothetical protein
MFYPCANVTNLNVLCIILVALNDTPFQYLVVINHFYCSFLNSNWLVEPIPQVAKANIIFSNFHTRLSKDTKSQVELARFMLEVIHFLYYKTHLH